MKLDPLSLSISLLAAVAGGRVQRGGEGMFAPYQLNGEDVRMALRHLARADLVALPLIGPPKLTPSVNVQRVSAACP